jgi:preprotein translocase subunit SecG
MTSWFPYITMFLLMVVGLLLIFIILLQRGRGGGLAGALGGMGGQSAFGTKAGDVFTKITVVLAIIWVALAAGNVFALRMSGSKFKGGAAAVPLAPALENMGGRGAEDEMNPPFGGELDTERPTTTPADKSSDTATDQPAEPETPAATETPATKTDSPDAAPADPKPDNSEAPAESPAKPE